VSYRCRHSDGFVFHCSTIPLFHSAKVRGTVNMARMGEEKRGEERRGEAEGGGEKRRLR
jgi:hypothetical protein